MDTSNINIVSQQIVNSQASGNATSSQINYFKKFDNVAEFKYICIKKQHFDVNMIYLNFTEIKDRKCIEIIYKSPSIYLDGLFFKTPPIDISNITVIHKDRNNNITIKLQLNTNDKEQEEFIKILTIIDEYIPNSLLKYSREINNELNNNIQTNRTNNTNINCIEMYRYDNILKQKNNNLEFHLKSYLDGRKISELEAIQNNTKYIFTFNISNIYFGNVNLIPLVKCNRCELFIPASK